MITKEITKGLSAKTLDKGKLLTEESPSIDFLIIEI